MAVSPERIEFMLQCKINQGGPGGGSLFARASLWRQFRAVILIGTSLLLAGCGSLPDIPDVVNPLTWFEDDEPAPRQASAAKKDFPKLSSVPERPAAPSLESQQAKIKQGLIADQRNARYTDSQIRREADRRADASPSVRQVPAAPSQLAAVPTPRRAAVPPPPQSRAVPPRPVARTAAPVPSMRAAVPPRSVARTAPPPLPPGMRPAAPPMMASTRPPALGSVPAPARQAIQLVAPTAPSLGTPGQPIKIGTIYFADNSKALQREDLNILRQVAEVQRSTGSLIRIVGHASGRARTFDATRRARINYEVSLDRAKSIAAALARMGVPPDRIQAEGAGDTAPIYAEYTASGEAANRRAELYMMLN